MLVMSLCPVTVLRFQNFILGLLLPDQTVSTATSLGFASSGTSYWSIKYRGQSRLMCNLDIRLNTQRIPGEYYSEEQHDQVYFLDVPLMAWKRSGVWPLDFSL